MDIKFFSKQELKRLNLCINILFITSDKKTENVPGLVPPTQCLELSRDESDRDATTVTKYGWCGFADDNED